MNPLRASWRVLARAAVLVVVLVVAGVVVGGVSALLRGSEWTSESQLLWDPSVRAQIDPSAAQPDSQAFDRQVADQQDVVLSDAVVARVVRATDVPAARIRDEVSVTSTAGSAAFTIAATARTAEEARAIARATTSAYVSTLQARNETLLQGRVTSLTAQVTALRRQLASASSATGAALANSIADLQTQLSAAQAALQDVPVEAEVQRAADVPSAPSSLSTAVQAIVGGALGAVLAVCVLLVLHALAPVLQRRREEAPTTQDAAPRSGTPLLQPTRVPPMPGREQGIGEAVREARGAIAQNGSPSPAAAAQPDQSEPREDAVVTGTRSAAE